MSGDRKKIWINPIGGLGDTLMLSGVLKQLVDKYPSRSFKMVRRPNYLSILEGHPAIKGIGFPRVGEEIVSSDYWSYEPLGPDRQRPMQILGRMFGLEDKIDERFYLAQDDDNDPLLDLIPWSSINVVIAPGSVSPRKEWAHRNFEVLTKRLKEKGIFVLQIGAAKERYVRQSYSLLGLTTPKQIFPILRRANLLITVDCFLMHAAHHVELPTVVLWGPSQPDVYGYPEQTHLYPQNKCQKPDGCIGPGKGENYQSPCPCLSTHCMDAITVKDVLTTVDKIINH
jgi:ADP-heptose:LPS heptosyltransferase